MTKKRTDARRIAIWQAMADHFLDTETRHDIPLTALRCVEAGCTTKEARDIWRFEVSPAVGFNVWQVAGEWAGWDEDWLVERIERRRKRQSNRPNWLRALSYRCRANIMDGVWHAIGRVMDDLLEFDTSTERVQRARDLIFLAHHYFDFVPNNMPVPGTAERDRLDSLYPEPFSRLMAPALVPGESKSAKARLVSAFDEEVRA